MQSADDSAMAAPEQPGVARHERDDGPSLLHSPSTDSSGSHVDFNPSMMPSADQCADYSAVWPGEWKEADANDLMRLGWAHVPVQQRILWEAYVPYWSRPDWDPNIETSFDGSQWRAVMGDAMSTMRPTIRADDSDLSRTEYTKRWGINPAIPQTSSGEARSGLTPTGIPSNTEGERLWTHEESWQSYIFDGFTTQELIDTGAYAPDAHVPVSDLPAGLSPLLRREKWVQPLVDIGIGGGGSGGKRNLNMNYNLGPGGSKKFDAENNDELWDALQPSLRLASRVIAANHPYWLMFLRGLFHMRKVPREYDGRTPAERLHSNYRQYRTLYPDLVRDEMYENARALLDLGFDNGQATMAILNNRLVWGFSEHQPPKNGMTCTSPDWKIRVLINANNIWPLLVGDYSESEKTGIRVKLASTILHELVHACHHAHHLMMEDPRRFLSNLEGINITPQMETCLVNLRREALGTSSNRAANGQQYFIENDVSMEEGKAFEDKLWGTLLEYHPPLAHPHFTPMVAGRGWPYTHPQVYNQNAAAARAGAYRDSTRGPYNTWLLFPRAAVYDLSTPIPVLNYARLLQSSWWDNEHLKYGNEAFKFSSTQADQPYPLQSLLCSKYNNFTALFMPLIGNPPMGRFVCITAPGILRAQNQQLILAWLMRTSSDAAISKILRLRLHYERRTWEDKYGNIQTRCNQIVQDLGAASGNLQGYLSGSGPVLDQVQLELNHLFRQELVQLHRLVDYESRYSQAIASEYFIKDLDDRQLVRRSMHRLLGHLQTLHNNVAPILDALTGISQGLVLDASLTEQAQDCESLHARVLAAHTAISSVMGILSGNTLDQRSGPGGRGPLAAVPTAQRELRIGRSLRIAAKAELARITNPALKRCIRTWLDIISVCQDIRDDDPDAEDVVVGGGSMADLRRARDRATADALGISYLELQAQVEANRASGRAVQQPGEGDTAMAELQRAMEQLETQSDDADLYSRSFSPEEQAQIRQGRHPH